MSMSAPCTALYQLQCAMVTLIILDLLRDILQYSIMAHLPRQLEVCIMHTPLVLTNIGEGGNSEGATHHFQDLCTNKPQQTRETLTWCSNFASVSQAFFLDIL
jgi:hypothetical protein